jgi:pimeloyl-ACP methyl ester carboxylesterase
MDILAGVALALGTVLFASVVRFDRDRAVYPVMLILIATYYDLFAVIADGAPLGWEALISLAFAGIAVLGFHVSLWVVVAGLAAHGVFDLFHERLIENAGVPVWWPAFCGAFDATAAVYLAVKLAFGRITAHNPDSFGSRIRPHVTAELRAAQAAETAGDPAAAFHHLERAHILGQASTVEHVRVHARMLGWGLRQRKAKEVAGQVARIIGAAAKTSFGLIPKGNTGGVNANPFKSMEIPSDLSATIANARAVAGTLLSIVVVASMLLSASACSTTTPQSRATPADDYYIASRVLGSGKPVMVMLSGLGDGMATFNEVAAALADSVTVITYDRSGYGDSGIADGPRDAAGAERELSRLLQDLAIPGPYVLMGHSLGGLFAEYYAAKHPDQIAGLILEDSRPADFATRCDAAGLRPCAPLPSMLKGAPQGAIDELLVLSATEAQVRSVGFVKNRPVLVLSRLTTTEVTSFEGVWAAAQNALAERYPRAQHLIAPGTGHYIHRDSRSWYVASIREFLLTLPK